MASTATKKLQTLVHNIVKLTANQTQLTILSRKSSPLLPHHSMILMSQLDSESLVVLLRVRVQLVRVVNYYQLSDAPDYVHLDLVG